MYYMEECNVKILKEVLETSNVVFNNNANMSVPKLDFSNFAGSHNRSSTLWSRRLFQLIILSELE